MKQKLAKKQKNADLQPTYLTIILLDLNNYLRKGGWILLNNQ